MNILCLPHEIQAKILSNKYCTNPNYFLLNKKICDSRNTISKLIYYIRTNSKIPKNRVPFIFLFLQLQNRVIKDDSHNYKLEVLEFIANTSSKEHTICCKNSYYRKIVHNYCDLFNIKHETIITSYKKGRVCRWCGEHSSYKISVNEYGTYDASCGMCNGHTFDWLSIDNLITYGDVPQKSVVIKK